MLCLSSQLLGRATKKSFPMNLNLLLETLSFIEMGKNGHELIYRTLKWCVNFFFVHLGIKN